MTVTRTFCLEPQKIGILRDINVEIKVCKLYRWGK